MKHADYLAYSAEAPMTLLRKAFNRGEDLHKPAPDTLPAKAALEDVFYTKFAKSVMPVSM